MIIYKDIANRLNNAGYSTYRLRKEHLLSESTIQRIREGKGITTDTLDTLCQLLKCQPQDLIEYRK